MESKENREAVREFSEAKEVNVLSVQETTLEVIDDRILAEISGSVGCGSFWISSQVVQVCRRLYGMK